MKRLQGRIQEVHTLPVRVYQLFCDIVEEVPASIGKRALQEGQSYQTNIIVTEGLKGVCWLKPVIVTCVPKKKQKPDFTDLKSNLM